MVLSVLDFFLIYNSVVEFLLEIHGRLNVNILSKIKHKILKIKKKYWKQLNNEFRPVKCDFCYCELRKGNKKERERYKQTIII